MHNPREWNQEPRGWTYWQRETLAFQSGMLERLPPGVRAPRCYGVMENEDGAWVWIEYVQESTGKRWPLETFQRTARRLGCFQGAYLCGTPLPDYPWLCHPLFPSIWADHDWWSDFMNPASEDNAWKSPLVQRGFDERQKSRVLRLLTEKGRFFDANERLPQVFCHNDCHCRNFMWTRSDYSGEEELIAIDWAICGAGALGNDLGKITVNSMMFFDYDPFDAETLTAAGVESYLAEIADAGAEVDARLVRLVHLIANLFWMGAALPGLAAMMLPPESGVNVPAMYGHSTEEVLAGWVYLDEYCLDQADEARHLIQRLGLLSFKSVFLYKLNNKRTPGSCHWRVEG